MSHRLCSHSGKSRSALYTRCTIQNDAHGNPPLGSEYTAVNGIFVHLLYGPVEHHGGGTNTSPTCNVHIIVSPVVPCTLGVWIGMTLKAMHHSALSTLLSTEFSYTRCTDQHTTMAAGPVRLPQAVYTFWEVSQCLVH